MAKKKAKKKVVRGTGEQLDLIDVAPENAKAIVAAVRIYKGFQAARLAKGHEEVKQKNEVLKLVKESKLPRLANGKIKFTYGSVEIEVTPRDELITIKEKAAK